MNKGLAGKIKISFAILSVILLAIFVANFVLPSMAVSGSANVWTDKTDYAPEDTVYISGANFTPNTPITQINVTRPDSSVDSCPTANCSATLPVTDAEGSFSNYAYVLDGVTGTYNVFVSDGTVSAQTTFTDSRTVTSVTLNGGNNTTVASGATITVVVNVTTSGSDDHWDSTGYQIGSGSWQCNNHANHHGDDSYTETFTITAPSSIGNYNFNIRVDSNDDCSSGQGGSSLSNAIHVVECIADSDCPDRAHTSKACASNVCGYTCSVGYGNCNNNMTLDGCEINLLDANNSNCGSCGNVCTGGQTCISGVCTTPSPQCGNGVKEGSEGCDDGNTANSDGCSAVCQVETGWTCSGTPSVCKTINQNLTSSCGIDIVLVMDSSGSIGTDITTMKTAFKSFVAAFLPNTPTQIAVVDFDTTASVIQGFTTNRTALNISIDSVSSGGTTNWDDALFDTASLLPNRVDKSDLIVFASDGNPNAIYPNGTSVSESVALAAAVSRANQIKLNGARIITLGIGSSINSANMIAISSADAYYSTNFSGLAQTLSALADDLCGGTISVKKLVDGQPTSGWIFTTSVTGGTSNPISSTTDSNGTGFINPVFDINISGTTATASVTETPQLGYGFVSAHCYKGLQEVGTPGTGTVTGIVIGKTDAIYCEFNNTAHECETNDDCNKFDNEYCDANIFKQEDYVCNQNTHQCELGQIIPTDCNDNNPCTQDSCSVPQGCSNTNVQDGTSCDGAPSGVCDAQDTCQSGVCVDNIQTKGTECRGAAGACDVAEYCDGSSKTCPNDSKSTALCRQSAGQCDAEEYCDGTNNTCPYDVFAPLSTPCDDGFWCSETDHCDGNNNCVQNTARDCSDNLYCTVNERCDEVQDKCVYDQRNCSANNIGGISTCNNVPDNFSATFDWRNTFTSICDEEKNECPIGNETIDHNCADADNTDGVFYYNSITQTCSAECDGAGTECQPKLENDFCYYNGRCNIDPTLCNCNYASQQYCPTPGTVTNGTCYYGERLCTENGCGLSTALMGCKNYCDPLTGPKDNVGPTTSGTAVDPAFNNGNFNTTSYTIDNCSNIERSEYFLGHSSIGQCGLPGSGTPMDATDGSFDELAEDLKKDNVFYNVFDGLNWICVQSKDVAGNWGNCDCAYFETDTLPPDCPYNIYLNQTLYPDEYLVCGSNLWLNATVCDQQSKIQGGEYFIDTLIPPVPAPWSGIWMNTLYNFTRADSWKCSVIGAFVNTSNLSEGTHYIKLRGKDAAENWGKIINCDGVSFIRDTKPPITNKTLIPVEQISHACEASEITAANLPANASQLTNGCSFVKVGTQITLNAQDQDTPDHEFADRVRIHWRIWYKVNASDPWVVDQEGTGAENQSVTITLSKDSYHLIEYWSVDSCGWEETHHYELDIVDTKPPVTVKTVGDPKLTGSGFDYWITQNTQITLSCSDQDPHPSDHVMLYARYNVDGGEWIDLTTREGYIQFHFTEDSVHTLEYWCVDQLGNTETHHIEVDKVDTTPPNTTKTYGTPLIEAVTGGYPKWINSTTPITLTAVDGGAVCAVGVNKTYWRNTLVDGNEPCESPTLCQQLEGRGSWNEYLVPFYKPEDSCHLIEYYSVDQLGNTEPVKKQCVYVDNKPPIVNKTLGNPKVPYVGITPVLVDTYDVLDPIWYVNQSTSITLSCTDQEPHPVDDVKIYYKYYNDNHLIQDWTLYTGPITYGEDTYHEIYYYCVDVLGNKGPKHVELDIVDTLPPVSNKTLGNPKHACTPEEQALYYPNMSSPTNGCYFITQQTPITLTCTDQNPHPVDNVKLYYRDYLSQPVCTNGGCGFGMPSWIEVDNDSVTIYKNEDSTHILEWYCVDALGNEESKHTEYDIVDTVPPVTTKTIIGPKFYNSTEEKTYINGVTEIELNCSDPDPHPVDHANVYYRYKVNDGAWNSWTLYTGKFKFPEESKHELEYFCNDTLGNEETHKFEIDYVDHTAPVTTKTYGQPYYTNGLAEWVNSSTSITLTATDGTSIHASGVNKTYYRVTQVGDDKCANQSACDSAVGSGIFLTYSTPFKINDQSCHLIEFYSVDNVNKTEQTKRQCVYVENTAPLSSKTIGAPKHECNATEKSTYGNDCWYVTQQTPMTLSCTDQNPHPVDNVALFYKIDWKQNWGDSWTLGSLQQAGNQITFNYSKDSFHRLTWYCVDALGNTEAQHVEMDIVDTQPPISQKSFDGTHIPCSELHCAASGVCDYYINQSTKIILTCADQNPHPVDHQKIYYRYFVDGVLHQDWIEYTGPIQYNEDSNHTLEWFCNDTLGNTETTHIEVDRVDTTPPVTTKTIGTPKWGANDYWVTSHTPITLTTVDQQALCAAGPATLYYQVWWDSNCDGTVDTKLVDTHVHTDANCNLNKTLYLNNECLNEIRWYAVDALGNKENNGNWIKQQHKVDNTPPHVLILKPVDGWYSDGEDIPIVAEAEDLNNVNSSCEQRADPCDAIGLGISCSNPNDCNGLGANCSVGIADNAQCYAYLVDVERTIDDIRDKKIPQIMINNTSLITTGTLLYNSQTKQCEGYATVPQESGLQDGIKILVVGVSDNLGNNADSLDEIGRAINERCGCDVYDMCDSECVRDVLQDIVTFWNLPRIGIDNNAPVVTITQPTAGTLFGGVQVYFSADVNDSTSGEITSTITSGTPCYVTLGGVSLGTVPYSNDQRKCSGTIMIPEDKDFPQGSQELKVSIADNAGNLGSDAVSVNVDTVDPLLSIIIPSQNQFVKGTLQVTAQVSDANLDASAIKISTDNGQTWNDVWYCNPSTYCFDWDTTQDTDGMAYGIIAKATDFADNTGYSEKVIVIVDNGAPEGVYVLDPIKDDVISGTITLKAIATDYVSGIDSVKIYVQSPVAWDCDATLIGGTWQCSFDSTALLDGQHQVYAVATDNMGHQTTTASVPFIIDNNAPQTPSEFSHIPDQVAGYNYDRDGTVTWYWMPSTDLGSGIDHYVLNFKEGSSNVVYGTKNPEGYITYTISDLIDYEYSVRVKAIDKAGHESGWTEYDYVTVDTMPPSALTVYGSGIENMPYDTDGSYYVNWNGGYDTNFDRFDISVDGATAGDVTSPYLGVPTQGAHRYQVTAYDEAGHSTISSFFDVFVDTITPNITENSQSSWGPIGWWFDFSIDDGTQSSGLLTPTYSSGLHLCSWNPDAKTGNCLVIGSASSLTVYVSDKAGHSASKTIVKGEETNTDFTPPQLLTTSPSGLINYNEVTLTATTDEPSLCKYGLEDNYSTMTEMSNTWTTSHTASLGTLADGLYVYHVRCEDMAGNMMEQSKTVVFSINTNSQYCYRADLAKGWDTFFLPKLILDDINFTCDDSPYYVTDVLESLYNGQADFRVVWYFDGTEWLFFDPQYPQFSTLTVFNDELSNPYFIYMNEAKSLDLRCYTCEQIPE